MVFLTKTGDVWTLHDEVSPLRLRSRRLRRPDGLLDRDRPARTAKFELTLAPALDLVGIEAKQEMPQLTDGQSPLAARSCTARRPISRAATRRAHRKAAFLAELHFRRRPPLDNISFRVDIGRVAFNEGEEIWTSNCPRGQRPGGGGYRLFSIKRCCRAIAPISTMSCTSAKPRRSWSTCRPRRAVGPVESRPARARTG